MMVLADGLIVQWVAVSLLITHIDHVAAWLMHDLLLEHQQELQAVDLVGYAADLGLDVDRFREDLRRHVGADRIADDVDSAGSSGVAGTSTSSSTAAANTGPASKRQRPAPADPASRSPPRGPRAIPFPAKRSRPPVPAPHVPALLAVELGHGSR